MEILINSKYLTKIVMKVPKAPPPPQEEKAKTKTSCT
jgi:hypothetical protein